MVWIIKNTLLYLFVIFVEKYLFILLKGNLSVYLIFYPLSFIYYLFFSIYSRNGTKHIVHTSRDRIEHAYWDF